MGQRTEPGVRPYVNSTEATRHRQSAISSREPQRQRRLTSSPTGSTGRAGADPGCWRHRNLSTRVIASGASAGLRAPARYARLLSSPRGPLVSPRHVPVERPRGRARPVLLCAGPVLLSAHADARREKHEHWAP
jgi:hypothetical protein